MQTKISTSFEQIRGDYWVVPALMIIGSIILSIVTYHIDRTIQIDLLQSISWLGVNDPEAARSYLSVISGSMISTTGVTFSITIAALVQASSQLGPRLLSNFLRDRGNQIVLGTLLATFTFCIFILKSISNTAEFVFIPHLSIAIATIFTILSIGALVFFFHHVSTSLQANYVISQVGAELQQAIRKIYPEKMEYPQEYNLINPEDIPKIIPEESYRIKSTEGGYLQAIDSKTLIEIAEENDCIMITELRPGEYTSEENTLVSIYPMSDKIEELKDKINNAFILGEERLRLQDIKYSIEQLVEIAIRALSAGINDPYTAIACIDQLTSGTIELFKRSITEGYYYDSGGKLRLVTKSLTFTDLIEIMYTEIRRNSSTNVTINIKLLESIASIIPHARTKDQRNVLKKQADILLQNSMTSIKEPYDLEEIQMVYKITIQELSA